MNYYNTFIQNRVNEIKKAMIDCASNVTIEFDNGNFYSRYARDNFWPRISKYAYISCCSAYSRKEYETLGYDFDEGTVRTRDKKLAIAIKSIPDFILVDNYLSNFGPYETFVQFGYPFDEPKQPTSDYEMFTRRWSFAPYYTQIPIDIEFSEGLDEINIFWDKISKSIQKYCLLAIQCRNAKESDLKSDEAARKSFTNIQAALVESFKDIHFEELTRDQLLELGFLDSYFEISRDGNNNIKTFYQYYTAPRYLKPVLIDKGYITGKCKANPVYGAKYLDFRFERDEGIEGFERKQKNMNFNKESIDTN